MCSHCAGGPRGSSPAVSPSSSPCLRETDLGLSVPGWRCHLTQAGLQGRCLQASFPERKGPVAMSSWPQGAARRPSGALLSGGFPRLSPPASGLETAMEMGQLGGGEGSGEEQTGGTSIVRGAGAQVPAGPSAPREHGGMAPAPLPVGAGPGPAHRGVSKLCSCGLFG